MPWLIALSFLALAALVLFLVLQHRLKNTVSGQPPQHAAVSSIDNPTRLIVADDSSYAPFSFIDLEGKPAGINIDFWKLWSRKTGIEVEFHLMEWDSALAAVRDGKADVIASLFKTGEREKFFDFTRPFFSISTSVFFHQQIHGIKGIEDLQGFPIGVVKGDSSEELLAQRYPRALLLQYPGAEAMVRAAVEGEIKVFVLDTETARFYLAKYDQQNIFQETLNPVVGNATHSAVKKGNTQLLAVVQQGFDQISEKEIQAIISSWTGKKPNSRISWSEVQLFGAVVAAFLTLFLFWNINLRKSVARALGDVERRNRELQESEARFKAFFDLAPFSCFVNDLQGRYRIVNQAFCSRVERREEDLIGRSSEDLGLFCDDIDSGRMLEELLRTGVVSNREIIFSSAEGPRYVLYSGRLMDVAGERLVFSSTVDITERKRTEEALKESEGSFIRLFEAAPIPMAFASDVDGYRATTWNESWYRTFGYAREEADGRSGGDIGLWVNPEDRGRFVHMVEMQSLVSGIEVLMRRRDGAIRHCEVFGRFIGKSGRQILMAAYLDITERKQAENALRESEERFSKAFRLSPVPLVISDPATGRFIDVNEQWLKMLGHSREETIGHTSFELGIWANPEIRSQMGGRLRREGSFSDVPVQFLTHDGGTRDILWSAAMINIGGEELMLSLVYDYTDKKQAEEEKEKLQTQLLQAQKMESIGRLAGGVAHDYNNMLGVILGHAELAMMKGGEDNPLKHHLKEITNAAQRSADLTQQLLAFARRQTIAPQIMDLNAAVAATMQMLRWLIGENIELAFLPKEEDYPVKIDPSQLDQILVNLCVNARDAIDGVGRISIETGETSLDVDSRSAAYIAPGDYVLLAVNDNGCGMDRETQAKIFEPFFTTKGIGQGTGLGLATVYGIVKQNDGFINVYSEPGKGTTFKIYLPRHAEGAMAARRAEKTETPASHGETILVVEDEAVLLDINATMLGDLGYRVLPAATPSEAIRLAGQHAGGIDLLMTDVVMPEMNGNELAQHIEKTQPGIRCLFMSGYTANVISHHGVLDEGVNFIQKPFSMKDLAAKISEVLAEPPGNGPLAERPEKTSI
jgi:PAS domain S-box-containing protein